MRQLKITHNITRRDSQTLERYLYEISKERLLKPEEEVALAKRIKDGDHTALEELTRANLRFVVSVAKQYQNQGLPLSDLINEGNLGLIKAAQKFDDTKGFKFISYAVWWIRQQILQSIVEQSKIVRLPLNKVSSMHKINRAMAEFEQEFQREPTDEELAVILDLNRDEINTLIRNAKGTISMDAPIGNSEDDFTLSDTIEDADSKTPEETMMKESLKRDIKRALKSLPDRDAEILRYYFGLKGGTTHTLEEIGSIFDLTRERVRQLKERALRRLKQATNSKELKLYLR